MKNNNRNKFKQGVYKPVNIEKYIGKKLPIFRSGWELKFFKWADCNENILKWGSENVIIPYLSPLDNKVHRYFVDNFIIFKDRNGNNNKFLIEIKPSKQTKRPVRSKKKKSSTMLYEQKTYCLLSKIPLTNAFGNDGSATQSIATNLKCFTLLTPSVPDSGIN